MHTLRVILGGLALLAVCLLVARALAARGGPWVARACKAFLPLWLVAAAINLWVGVAYGGYSVAEEAPIFLVVFLVPASAALLTWWLAARR